VYVGRGVLYSGQGDSCDFPSTPSTLLLLQLCHPRLDGRMCAVREEHRLRVFENRVLRRIFGPQEDQVAGKGKGEGIAVRGRVCPKGCETSRLPHFPDNRLTDGGEVISLTRLPHLYLQEDS
jgi:hypothetical protein